MRLLNNMQTMFIWRIMSDKVSKILQMGAIFTNFAVEKDKRPNDHTGTA